jgi:hypothetical protein
MASEPVVPVGEVPDVSLVPPAGVQVPASRPAATAAGARNGPKLWQRGLALVIVRGRREVGTLTVIARSDGLQEARLVIRAL